MSKDTGGGGGVKAVQQKSKVELLFLPCGFPKGEVGNIILNKKGKAFYIFS